MCFYSEWKMFTRILLFIMCHFMSRVTFHIYIVTLQSVNQPSECVRGPYCAFMCVGKLNAGLALESTGTGDSFMVHRQNGQLRPIRAQDSSICISTESEPVRKAPSIEGKLVWRVNERMLQKHIHAFTASGQRPALLLRSCWKTRMHFSSHFFLLCVGCLAVRSSWSSSRGRTAHWSNALPPLDLTVL